MGLNIQKTYLIIIKNGPVILKLFNHFNHFNKHKIRVNMKSEDNKMFQEFFNSTKK